MCACEDYPHQCKLQSRVAALEKIVATLMPGNSASSPTDWKPNRPKRCDALAWSIFVVLEAAHRQGRPRPTAVEMLEAFGNHRPPEVCEVMANEIKFITNKGNIKLASLAAIRGRIHRMTTIQPAIDGVH